jgi:hypothetical protein
LIPGLTFMADDQTDLQAEDLDAARLVGRFQAGDDEAFAAL